MSRTRKAVLGSAFAYANFALALVSGFVLFPLIVWRLGAYDYGLWLITGELVGYLLLGDLGVFTVLPWLVAARDGAGDRAGIARHLADALMVAVVVGLGAAIIGGAIWWLDPTALGVNPVDWGKVRGPLALVVVLVGAGFPFRAFTAILGGLQDVTFVGLISLCQTALTIALTATLILLGYGLSGLAVATGVPPILAGMAAAVRVAARFRYAMAGWYRPRLASCWHLIREGFGAWLSNLGARLQTASSGLVFALLGRPVWATLYAATAKVAHVTRPMCIVIPDTGLIGLSQMHGEGDLNRTRRLVICLLILYVFIPGLMAIVVLATNSWFVRAWLGSNYYAGDYVNGLIVVNMLLISAVGGLFKVVTVVGYRVQVGISILVFGATAAGMGYVLGRERGMAGLMEGAILAGIGLGLPLGLYILRKVYGIGIRELILGGLGRWLVLSVPILAIAAWVGPQMALAPVAVVALVVVVLIISHVILLRSVMARIPWPDRIREWLSRLWVISPTPPPGTHV